MVSRLRRLFSSSGSNYPYVTARVRALKTHLLAEDEYPKMIARDVHEIARSLQEVRYKNEVDELAGTYSGAQLVERATRLNMGREFRAIHSWCQGEPRRLIGLYFERYDVHNVKTLLRGAQAGADRESTRAALIPAGTVPEEAYLAALGAQSLEDVILALEETPYGSVVADLEGTSLAAMENQLDVAYYRSLVDGVEARDRPSEAFLAFLKREIDIVNLKLVLRAKHADVTDYELVPGGRHITDELARRIRTAGWNDLQPILDETRYGEVLSEALDTYQRERDLNEIAAALDHFNLEQAANFGHRYPLSILPIVDYVLRKRHEVDRIRIIAFGKQQGLEREEIEQLVNV